MMKPAYVETKKSNQIHTCDNDKQLLQNFLSHLRPVYVRLPITAVYATIV